MSDSDNPVDETSDNGSNDNTTGDDGAKIILDDQSSTGDNGGSSDNGKHSFEKGIFKRFLYMVGFAIVAKITVAVMLLLSLIQLIFTLINKSPNGDLKKFMGNLAEYLKEIVRFLGFVTEEKPCPFSPFPSVGAE
jgi:hypothetical protein